MNLELKQISKHYGDLRANDCVDLTVRSGTIHAVLGENGAGKSTLMKILSGYLRRTAGRILMDGRQVEYRSPAEAAALGIGMLYQDPFDFPNLSVLENFMLGQVNGLRQTPGVFRRHLEEMAARFGFHLQPHARVARLTVGERQQLEILRLLTLGIRVLILDEPTTGISAEQKRVLFNALRRLARDGRSVLLVSHKLEDVQELCDELTVLRHGRVTGCLEAPFETRRVLELMFDHLPSAPRRQTSDPGAVVLEMEGVEAAGGRTGLGACDVRIHSGDLVGLAGLEGSGQGVFLRVAAGLTVPSRGVVRMRGNSMAGKGHRAFQAAGIGFLPSGRLEEGLLPGLSIREHAALVDQSAAFLIDWDRAARTARRRIETFRIKGAPETTVEDLSGGNQQRLLLACLPAETGLLLLENPTRGLDLESSTWVWNHLLARHGEGTGIVFSSSELDEILMVANRILVFYDGRIIADVAADRTDSRRLGRAIAGKV